MDRIQIQMVSLLVAHGQNTNIVTGQRPVWVTVSLLVAHGQIKEIVSVLGRPLPLDRFKIQDFFTVSTEKLNTAQC